MTIDVKEVMRTLLERQKEYVLEDREHYSWAMVAVFTEGNKSYVRFPKFDDEETKIAAYTEVVSEAKRKHASLIITVNNARQLRSDKLEGFRFERWGEFNQSNSDPCILLTASGPVLNSCSLQLRYDIIEKAVTFGEEEWLDRVELGLLPGWASEITHAPS